MTDHKDADRTAAGRVLRELSALDVLFTSIRSVVERHDPERRRQLIELRRQLTKAIGDIDHAGTELLRQPAPAKEFRRQMADLRYRIAEHQSAWPAVMIDDSGDYRRSATGIMDAYARFASWLRQRVADA